MEAQHAAIGEIASKPDLHDDMKRLFQASMLSKAIELFLGFQTIARLR